METKDISTMTSRELAVELVRQERAIENANAAYAEAERAYRRAENMPEDTDIERAYRTVELDNTRPVFEEAKRAAHEAAAQARTVTHQIAELTANATPRLTESEMVSAGNKLPLFRAEAEILDLDGVRQRIQEALLDDDRSTLYSWLIVAEQRLKAEPPPPASQLGTFAAQKATETRDAIKGQIAAIKAKLADARYADLNEEAVKIRGLGRELQNRTRQREDASQFGFVGANDVRIPD